MEQGNPQARRSRQGGRMVFRLIPGFAFVTILCAIALAIPAVQHRPSSNLYRVLQCHEWKHMGCFLNR
jgi:hypothetical protein